MNQEYDRDFMLNALAYRSWMNRGQPMGSPNIDWAIAEQHLAVQEAVLMAFAREQVAALQAPEDGQVDDQEFDLADSDVMAFANIPVLTDVSRLKRV